jgi:hypothetical protein
MTLRVEGSRPVRNAYGFTPSVCSLYREYGSLDVSKPYGPSGSVTEIALPCNGDVLR